VFDSNFNQTVYSRKVLRLNNPPRSFSKRIGTQAIRMNIDSCSQQKRVLGDLTEQIVMLGQSRQNQRQA